MPFEVPTQGSTGRASLVNQILGLPTVAYNLFSNSSLYSAVGPSGNGVTAAGGLWATYSGGSWSTATDLYNGPVSQPFTTVGATTLKGVEILPTVIGDPRSTLVCQLFATSGGLPTGNALQEVRIPASIIAAKAAAAINPTLGCYGNADVNVSTPNGSGVAAVNAALTPGALVGVQTNSPTGNAATSWPLAFGSTATTGNPRATGLGAPQAQIPYPVAYARGAGPILSSTGISFTYYGGTVYGVGGLLTNAYTASNAMYSASVDNTGTVGAWSAQTALPPVNGLAFAASVVLIGTDGNPYLVVMGGQTISAGALTPNSQVYWIQLAQGGGTVGSWVTMTPPSLPIFTANNLWTTAANWNGNGVVGAVDPSGAQQLPTYLINNSLPTAVGFQAIPASFRYSVGATAQIFAGPWQSNAGPLYGIGGNNNGVSTGPVVGAPLFVVKANATGAWASNPYPALQTPVNALLSGNENGCILSNGDGTYSVVIGGSFVQDSSFAVQLEAFRVPFNVSLNAATTYAMVFSLLGTAGATGPGSSVGMSLAETQNPAVAASQRLGGTWTLVAGTGKWGQVAGYVFDTGGNGPVHSQYSGFVDTTATVIPRWEVVYWNQWTEQPECIVSVAGNQGELILPTLRRGREVSA